MTKQKAMQAVTEKSHAQLIKYGVPINQLESMEPKAKRVLADSLESEFKRLSASPGSRKATEGDVRDVVLGAIEASLVGHRKIGIRTLANNLDPELCTTNAGTEIVSGIRLSMQASVKSRSTA